MKVRRVWSHALPGEVKLIWPVTTVQKFIKSTNLGGKMQCLNIIFMEVYMWVDKFIIYVMCTYYTSSDLLSRVNHTCWYKTLYIQTITFSFSQNVKNIITSHVLQILMIKYHLFRKVWSALFTTLVLIWNSWYLVDKSHIEK